MRGANVGLIGRDRSVVARTVTNGAGSFRFDVLDSGVYEVDAHQPGFNDAQIPIRLMNKL